MGNENRNDYSGFINQLKLSMFNIIAGQESKLSGLIDYLNSQPQGVDISQLIDLYNKQRNLVSSLTIFTSDLSNVLDQLDYNDDLISKILAESTSNVNQAVANDELEFSDVPDEQTNSNYDNVSGEPPFNSGSGEDEAKAEDSVSDENTVTGFVETSADSEIVKENVNSEESAVTSEPTNEIVETSDVSDNSDDKAVPDIDLSTDEAPIPDTIVETSDVSDNSDDKAVPDIDLSTDEASIPNTIVETSDISDNNDDKAVPDIDLSTDEASIPDTIVETSDVSDNRADKAVPDSGDSNKDEVSTPIAEDNVKSEDNDKAEAEKSSTEDIIPATTSGDTTETVVSIPKTVLEDVVETPVVTEVVPSVVDEKPADNVIQIKAESLDGGDEVSDTPIASLSDEKVDESSETIVNFVANDSNFSRAILINKKQAGKLRGSILQQTELFNSFSLKSKNGSDLEITADNLEEMIEKATSLYAAEKVDEAEALMQKIDEFRSKQSGFTR